MMNWNRPILSLLLGTAIGALTMTPASAATRPVARTAAPQLSIAVANGVTIARSGQHLNYTIAVHNLGAAPVKRFVVSQPVPADLLRLATVACAGVSAASAPLVCAAHSDQLPAGAAQATAAAAGDTASPRRIWRPRDLGIGVALALAALGVAGLNWRRTKARRRARHDGGG